MQFETLYSVNDPAKSVVILKNFVPATNGTSILLYRDNNTHYSLTSDSLQTLFDSGDYVIDFNGDVAQISMLNSSKYKMKAIGTQDFVFNGSTATFNTQTNYRYVLDDWDTAWAIQTKTSSLRWRVFSINTHTISMMLYHSKRRTLIFPRMTIWINSSRH